MPMSQAPVHPRDPLAWHVLIALAFLGLVFVRLGIPSKPFFDEVHYLPAARALIALSHPVNIEHPLLGKELIALGIMLFGDNPFGWRIMPALFGTLALFAAMRALWFASNARFASIAGGILLATAFPLLVQSRIAMLDVFMASFLLVALWAVAGALRENETGRRRLAIAGVALGLSMASKWNAVPLAMVPGLAFAAIRLQAAGWRSFVTSRSAPVPGITMWEAVLWLGLVPLATYALTFLPALFYASDPLAPDGLVELHRRIIELQGQVVQPHTYQSVWYEWVTNWRGIWYLYEPVDGAQRGILLIGNPLTMILGLGAVVWAGWAGIARGRKDALAMAVLYAVALGTWVVAQKPVQFYYHYLLPSCFLIGALALALDALWRRGHRWVPLAVLAGSAGFFAYFLPVLTAAPLTGEMSFLEFTWLDSWR
jgi:dolichyl-phosphate-mannose--protein O-mannosyl transferase